MPYIHGVYMQDFSQGRLAPAIRIQRLLNAFEAGVVIAAVDGGPFVELYMQSLTQTRVRNWPLLRNLWNGDCPREMRFHLQQTFLYMTRRTTSSSSDQRVLAVPTLCGLIVRLAREIFGNLMPTTIMLSDYLLEQFVLLERPSPPSECGIEGMDTVFAAVAAD